MPVKSAAAPKGTGVRDPAVRHHTIDDMPVPLYLLPWSREPQPPAGV